MISPSVLVSAKLLIIEDDPQIIALYNHLFESHAAELKIVMNAVKVASLEKEYFDIIISDTLLGDKHIGSFSEEIRRTLKKDGLFYLASGNETSTGLQEAFGFLKAFFQKPLEPQALISAICLDYASNHYGVPNTSSILKDYDYDQEKYQKAIHLLIKEWNLMNAQLGDAIITNNLKTFIAIEHKLITSIRRLELIQFEKKLQRVRELLTEESGSSPELAVEIKVRMDYYIWYIQKDIDEKAKK